MHCALSERCSSRAEATKTSGAHGPQQHVILSSPHCPGNVLRDHRQRFSAGRFGPRPAPSKGHQEETSTSKSTSTKITSQSRHTSPTLGCNIASFYIKSGIWARLWPSVSFCLKFSGSAKMRACLAELMPKQNTTLNKTYQMSSSAFCRAIRLAAFVALTSTMVKVIFAKGMVCLHANNVQQNIKNAGKLVMHSKRHIRAASRLLTALPVEAWTS